TGLRSHYDAVRPMSQKPEHLVALDVGNSSTRVLVAEIAATDVSSHRTSRQFSNGSPSREDPSLLQFVGFGEVETRGWHKGNLADIGQASETVRRVIEQAEESIGSQIESAVLGIGGPHLGGLSSRAGIALSIRPREVRREDVLRVMQDARNIPLSGDREILHIVPKEFVLDGQEGIRDPVGMVGMQLEVRVHFITNSAATAQNLVTVVNRAGILVETVVSEGFAAGEALPSQEERDLGVLVVLIGGPSSETVAYSQGGLASTHSTPIGGDHFTGDIAIGLHTARSDAETIKQTFGSVFPGWSHDGSSFEVPGIGHQPSRLIPQNLLRQILEPRAQELFSLLGAELGRAGLTTELAAGIILSGGGARLAGLCDLAEKVLGIPARIGLPPRIHGLPEALDSPEYATLLSLLYYGLRVRLQRSPRESGSPGRLRDLLAWKK
ncbi:MAG: cell division protein FtsA, partial [Acidobacteria bacterium]|nr:cell division protein FtsA [Acidobacteriota bacterium]